MKGPKKEIQIQKKKTFKELITQNWFVLLLFFGTTFLAYSNSFNVPFQFDDHNQISFRESCHSFDVYKDINYWFKVNERPVSFFTITTNYVLHGERVFGYHIINFLIHLLAGIILFLWLKLIFNIKGKDQKKEWIPIVITLFFLLHPVQTQSVTYIIQRMTSLAGMFFLLSMYLYTLGRINFYKEYKQKLGVILSILAIFSGVLGILSKQNVIVFPLAMLLIELFFIRDNDGKISRKYLITSGTVLMVIFIVSFYKYGLPAETGKITPLQYLATQMIVIPRYFQMMLIPVGLSIDHGVKIVDGFLNLKVIAGLLIIFAIIGYGIYMLKKSPIVSFGIFWIFITLLVESSIIPISDPMFDQRMYLPLVGFAISFWGILDYYIFSKKPGWIKPVSVSILLLFSVMTFARNKVWQDRVAIWTDVTEKYPEHARGWIALGKMLKNTDEKDVQRIIECFEKARKLDPDNEEAILELGFHYLKIKQEEKSIACYTYLLNSKEQKNRIQARRVLSAYNISRNNDSKGLQYLKDIIAEVPTDDIAHKNICSYFLEKKDYSNALVSAQEWIKMSPVSSEALFNAGKACFYLNERISAKDYFSRVLKINPNHIEAMLLYANTCINTFDYDEAVKYLEKAYSITKDNTIPGHIAMVKQLKSQQIN